MNERSNPFPSLLIVLLLGALLYAPTVNYPGFLKTSTHDGFMATGDHGRDLYAFERTSLGERPYQDYWWVYGPLMPYYYGAFMKILGANMHAVQIGKIFLHLGSGALFLLILARFMGPILAVSGAIWFLFFNQNFYHTYNDIGGIFLMLAVLLWLFRFMESRRPAHFMIAQALLVLLFLIKINIGACITLAYYASLIVTDATHGRKGNFKLYALSLIGVLLVSALVYAFFLQGLSASLINQYFPLFNAEHISLGPIANNVRMFFGLYWQYFTFSAASITLALFVLGAFILTTVRLIHDKEEAGRQMIDVLIVLVIFYLSLLHEYILTGIFYRIFWSAPLTILMMFSFIQWASAKSNQKLVYLLSVVLLIIVAVQWFHRIQDMRAIKTPGHFLAHPKAMVYLENEPSWIKTVSETADFLEKNIQPQESFLALPYDPLYYFLTSRKSPTRQLIFVKTAGPDDTEQAQIIASLEAKNINWIALSNAAHHEEESIGTFGVTHGRVLNSYIKQHFHVIQEFGDFSQPGAWASRHAVLILRKN